MQILLGKGGMQPPNLEFKKGLKVRHFLAHQMQNFPSQSGVQTPKIIYRPIYKFRLKKRLMKLF